MSESMSTILKQFPPLFFFFNTSSTKEIKTQILPSKNNKHCATYYTSTHFKSHNRKVNEAIHCKLNILNTWTVHRDPSRCPRGNVTSAENIVLDPLYSNNCCVYTLSNKKLDIRRTQGGGPSHSFKPIRLRQTRDEYQGAESEEFRCCSDPGMRETRLELPPPTEVSRETERFRALDSRRRSSDRPEWRSRRRWPWRRASPRPSGLPVWAATCRERWAARWSDGTSSLRENVQNINHHRTGRGDRLSLIVVVVVVVSRGVRWNY